MAGLESLFSDIMGGEAVPAPVPRKRYIDPSDGTPPGAEHRPFDPNKYPLLLPTPHDMDDASLITAAPESSLNVMGKFLESLGITPGEKNPFLRDLGLLMATRKPGPLSFIAEPLKGAVELETSRGSATSKAAIEYAKIGATMAKTSADQLAKRLEREFKREKLDVDSIRLMRDSAMKYVSGTEMGIASIGAKNTEEFNRLIDEQFYKSLWATGRYTREEIETMTGVTEKGMRISRAYRVEGARVKEENG